MADPFSLGILRFVSKVAQCAWPAELRHPKENPPVGLAGSFF